MTQGEHSETTAIFVYGTLMEGLRNADYVAGCPRISGAWVEGYDLYDLGRYPAALPGAQSSKVLGEICLVDDQTLARVNELEEEGSLYRAVPVTAHSPQGDFDALVYVYLHEVPQGSQIPLADQPYGVHGLPFRANLGAGAAAWLDGAPADVVSTTERLWDEVLTLRKEETIYPPQNKIFNALELTAPQDVRVVILGQDPYHGPGQAMGLSFSVARDQKLPPSLRNIYKEMAADLGCAMPTTGDLTSWARQGVLLLNTTLTVREHAANSHAKLGWSTLTDYLVERCLTLPQPVVFLAWGRFAVNMVQKQMECLNAGPQTNKFCLASTHPSPLSATRSAGGLQAFMGSRPFSTANRLLEEHGTVPIDWPHVG